MIHEPETLRLVGDFAQEHFGLHGPVEALPGEFDLNFKVGEGAGARLLKLAPQDRLAILDLTRSALTHLKGLGGRVPVPVPPMSRTGAEGFPQLRVAGVPFSALCLTFLPGSPLGVAAPPTPALTVEVGELLGTVDLALAPFDHPTLDRPFPWRLDQGLERVASALDDVDAATRPLVERALERARTWIDPLRGELPVAVIHNDVNDYNILVGNGEASSRVTGLIDFGDMVRGWRAAEPAVAGAYLMMGARDPVERACHLVRGYGRKVDLTDEECAALVPLAALRLCLSITVQSRQIRGQPENEYLSVSQAPARALLQILEEEDWHLAESRVRHAAGKAPVAALSAVNHWIAGARKASPMDPDLLTRPTRIDLGVESLDLPHPDLVPNGPALDSWVVERLEAAGATVGVGRYCEARLVYDDPLFDAPADPVAEARTIHIGLDLFLPPGTPIRAVLPGTVETVRDNAAHLDYGPTVVLRHEPEGPPPFYTLYGHLNAATLEHRAPGERVSAGDVIGWLGDRPENGGWPPHLHLQLVLSSTHGPAWDPERLAGFPGVARPGLVPVWTAISPDPAALSGLPGEEGDWSAMARLDRTSELRDRRARTLGPSLSLAYDEPLHIVRGRGAYLYDASGRNFLDTVNNVAHVGHGNLRVWDALRRQSRVLNTNTRYLHDEIIALAEELKATLPDSLEVLYFVCSGSEANELALRLARSHTGRRGVVVLDGGYHGNTEGLVAVSPYKFDGPGGAGGSPDVAVAPTPDPYRLSREEALAGLEQALTVPPDGPAALLVEPILSCAGQIVPWEGYLSRAFESARHCGAVCIADEVQVGFGRVGDAFWGFEAAGAHPDVVTMGKPMGNGHPIGAVATTRAIAESFSSGMEYFNTFGGNPVSCAVARAVLSEILDHGLQARAASMGAALLEGLREIAEVRPVVGDVRGRGLFLGVELVSDPERKTPAPGRAKAVVEALKR
ncbi:MAG: aminotransferase class III-fold pyridoxal phosphate-dependent enzyme, partial [Gemmatimonadota bacterium]|nr:aminotransferase class III-fold pyridoxal phosphate-dependent enzyme [Gemmatimonadota bacterium]